MRPSLPQFDTETDQRAAAILHGRRLYQLDRDFGGLPFPTSIPIEEALTPSYLALGARWEGASYANIAATQVRWMQDDPDGGLRKLWQRAKKKVYVDIERQIWGPHRDVRLKDWKERTPLDTPQYETAFPLVRQPQSQGRWRSDEWFAYQRLAGTNPVLIEAISEIPAKLGSAQERLVLTEAFAESLEQGRVFQVDYAMLDGIEAGTGAGWRKWLCAPIALFELTPDRKTLLPIVIQCAQQAGPENPLFTPADGISWMMAKTVVQVADSNYHGVVEHGTYCHMMMGVICVCLHRTLAPNHPLRILLSPNLELTLKIDDMTRSLFLPKGRTPVIQSVSETGTLDLARWAYDTFNWRDRSMPREFTRRGVADPELLPDYPYRDDITSHWELLVGYVAAYIELYYEDDEMVLGDVELQAFVAALKDPELGNIAGIGDDDGYVLSVQSLVDFVAQIIWRATSYHAVINYSVYDAMGLIPNMPMAQYAPPPRHKDHPWEDFLAMLPPRSEMYRQFDDTFVVGSLRYNRLGVYTPEYFADARVRPIVEAFQAELAELELEIGRRNRSRLVPYEILLPSNVTASIHI